MLYKNFGVTRLNRVVFYDYDEIEYMTDCNFRMVPQSQHDDDEMNAEAWYRVEKRDMFPEQWGMFLLGRRPHPRRLPEVPRRPAGARSSGTRASSASRPATSKTCSRTPPTAGSGADMRQNSKSTEQKP